MTPRSDGWLESMEILSNEMNLTLSREIDSMVRMMHAQIKRTINFGMSQILQNSGDTNDRQQFAFHKGRN